MTSSPGPNSLRLQRSSVCSPQLAEAWSLPASRGLWAPLYEGGGRPRLEDCGGGAVTEDSGRPARCCAQSTGPRQPGGPGTRGPRQADGRVLSLSSEAFWSANVHWVPLCPRRGALVKVNVRPFWRHCQGSGQSDWLAVPPVGSPAGLRQPLSTEHHGPALAAYSRGSKCWLRAEDQRPLGPATRLLSPAAHLPPWEGCCYLRPRPGPCSHAL